MHSAEGRYEKEEEEDQNEPKPEKRGPEGGEPGQDD
jgi:hypothetical protein